MNFPNGKWGYIDGLDKCAGKTIEKAEVVRMELGSTRDHAWVVLFTDGTKAFFAGQRGTGIMNPEIEGMKESSIFTPEEVGEIVAQRKRKTDQLRKNVEKREREAYETLKKKFGGG